MIIIVLIQSALKNPYASAYEKCLKSAYKKNYIFMCPDSERRVKNP